MKLQSRLFFAKSYNGNFIPIRHSLSTNSKVFFIDSSRSSGDKIKRNERMEAKGRSGNIRAVKVFFLSLFFSCRTEEMLENKVPDENSSSSHDNELLYLGVFNGGFEVK